MLGEGGRKLGGKGKESTRGRIFLGGGRYEQIFGWWGGGGAPLLSLLVRKNM